MMKAFGFFAFIVIAVLVLSAVLVWLVVKNNGKNSKCCGNKRQSSCGSNALLSADAVETGTISITVDATGTEGGTATTTTGFITILSTNICTQRCHNRLYAAVSLQSAITAASVLETGPTGIVGSTLGIAQIEIQVLVDGIAALPGTVVFDGLLRIIQQGLDPLTEAVDALSLTEANSFNFVVQGITHGPHTIEVQARLTVLATNTVPIGETVTAAFGNRSLVVSQGNAYVFVPPVVSTPTRNCF